MISKGKLGVLLAVLLILLTAGTYPAAGAAGAVADREFRHGMVRVDGGAIHYAIGGSGPPLVLLHGWTQTWIEWRQVMRGLAGDYTVIALDLPGLGDSSHFNGGYDKKTTAARIRQAVNRLGFHQVEIMAHDIGAPIAYRYARDFPGEVTRLLVLESLLAGFGEEDDFAFTWHYLFLAAAPPFPEQIVDQEDVPAFFNYFYDKISHHKNAMDRDEFLRAYSDPADRIAGYEYYRALPVDAADNQANIDAERLRIPLVAMGAQHIYGPRVAQVYRRVADDVREVVAPDTGHFVPEEAPGFLIECARLFFGDRPSAAPPPELAGCAP